MTNMNGIIKKVLIFVFCFLLAISSWITNVSAENETDSSQPGENETVQEYSMKIVGKNVSHSSQMYLLYAVDLGELPVSVENYEMLFWKTIPVDGEFRKGTEEYISKNAGIENINGKDYYTFYSYGLAAKQMTEDLYCRCFVRIDGQEYYSKVEKYSILDYCYNRIEKGGDVTDTQLQLYLNMLKYGGSAQKIFNWDLDRLADATYYSVDVINGACNDGFNHGRYQPGETVTISPVNPDPEQYEFAHWKDKYGFLIKEETYSFQIGKENLSFTAFFKEIGASDNEEEEAEYTHSLLFTPYDEESGRKGECYVSGINDKSVSEVIIPSKWNDLLVTGIGHAAFSRSQMSQITIPDSVNTIEDMAFYECQNLSSIRLPEGLKVINSEIFYGCKSLQQVMIPRNVENIVYTAFYNTCLEEIYVDVRNTTYRSESNCLLKGDTLIRGCKNSLIPSGITKIEDYAFAYSDLTSFVIPDGVLEIGSWAFSGCSLLTSISIPESVNTIGYACFQGNNLETIKVDRYNSTFSSEGNCIIDVRDHSLIVGCKNTVIPDHVRSIGENAFRESEQLTDIVIPGNVKSIGANAFARCTGLRNVTIEEGLTEIQGWAFVECTSLSQLTLPKSLTKIDTSAFWSCGNVNVHFMGTEKEWKQIVIENWNDDLINAPITFGEIEPEWTVELKFSSYLHGHEGECYVSGISDHNLDAVIIPSTYEGMKVTGIGDGAFAGCSNVMNISLPEGIESIGSFAFLNCESLSTIKLPDEVISIGAYAFKDCVNLSSVTLSENLESIGDYAFANCESLTHITIPVSVSLIESRVFIGCTQFTEVFYQGNQSQWNTVIIGLDNEELLQATITFLGQVSEDEERDDQPLLFSDYDEGHEDECFVAGIKEGYSLSSELIIPATFMGKTVTGIGELAFNGRSELVRVQIPETLTVIGDHAFQSCSNLTSINIPESVTSIGSAAFNFCTSLTEIVIPSSVKTIEENAFNYCRLLERVTLPEKMDSIKKNAFSFCSSLTEITIPEGIATIETFAFSDCTALRKIILPSTLTLIDTRAFSDCNVLSDIYYNGTEKEWKCVDVRWYGNDSIRNNEIHYLVENQFVLHFAEYPEGHEGEVYVAGYEERFTLPSEMVIPSTYNGMNVTGIGEAAFTGCEELVRVVLPETINSIGDRAFNSCAKLIDITIPESVTRIGGAAFNYCTSLVEIVIPNSVKAIEEYTFYRCSALKRVTLPETMENINNGAFSYCSSLTEISIPEGITTIGTLAFDECSNLHKITLPNSLQFIESRAFSGCNQLNEINFQGTQEEWLDVRIYYGNDCFSNAQIKYMTGEEESSEESSEPEESSEESSEPEESSEESSNPEESSEESYETEESSEEPTEPEESEEETSGSEESSEVPPVQETDEEILTFMLFSEDTGRENEYFVSGLVEEIENVDGITELVIPSTHDGKPVTGIGPMAFENMSNLQSVILPEGLKSIGSCAFSRTTNLMSIVIPDSVIEIGTHAFEFSGIYTITIPENVTVLEFNTFMGCEFLCEVSLPKGLTQIGNEAFKDCRNLISIAIPDTVELIWFSAFENCKQLNSITIPGSVEMVEADAFKGCTELRHVTLSEGVQLLGGSVFEDCDKVEDISIPTSLRVVADSAFMNCGVPTIEVRYSGNHQKWATVSVGANNEKWYEWERTLFGVSGNPEYMDGV